MKALIQRVQTAKVEVSGKTIGQIDKGILLLLGIEKDDDENKADWLLERILNYRIFADEKQRMNLSLRDIQGGLLIVSQFTLVADTRKGLRPSFSEGADPISGERLYDYFINRAHSIYEHVSTGSFGADMQVSLINDGPVTFWLETK
ncbi:D-tyrosyl-tRNA(Tyr) deacylase [Pokkaliibacter plantistimulans]|uniref:D-aminoacyl-tRNA deacylase n=1 Tax=Proteobacteria bacterium 228 TaxID=2083153 RepID=A0A2S5KN85_9PROT|nr:D-aminoacyl-tRNA deacylase [Pokkaliibacter plantistimulans]PPC75766.1 D-tyrosyl-tRNA(Tyr) deacylase [Pokkaliibacter plantistimulans]